MRRPERPCQRKPRLVHVDRDNRLASGYFGSHQGRQADGAHSEYRERISRFWPHRIKYGAGTGLSAAGEWSKELERGVFPDLHNVTFVGDDVSCERRLLEESAVDGGAVLAHERGTVGARAAHFQLAGVHAMKRQVAPAIRTRAAPGKRDDDVIAWREFRDTRTDGLHHSRPFVAVYCGIGAIVVTVPAVQIGLTHPARNDPDQCLVRPRIGQSHFLNRERAELFAHHGSGDFHEPCRAVCVGGGR